jgi:hypothetical protein
VILGQKRTKTTPLIGRGIRDPEEESIRAGRCERLIKDKAEEVSFPLQTLSLLISFSLSLH